MKDEHGNEVQDLPKNPSLYLVYYLEVTGKTVYGATYQTANRVAIRVPTSTYHIEMAFSWPEERHKAMDLCRMLECAHKFGIADGKAQVRHALGI